MDDIKKFFTCYFINIFYFIKIFYLIFFLKYFFLDVFYFISLVLICVSFSLFSPFIFFVRSNSSFFLGSGSFLTFWHFSSTYRWVQWVFVLRSFVLFFRFLTPF